MLNNYDEAIVKLARIRYDLIKNHLAWLGLDPISKENDVKYRNYLANDPLITGSSNGYNGGNNWKHIGNTSSIDKSLYMDENGNIKSGFNVDTNGNIYQLIGGTSNGIDGNLDVTGDCGISIQMVKMICKCETGSNFDDTITDPKLLNGFDGHDAKGHRTFAYGLLMHPTQHKYMDEVQSSYSNAELKNLFMQTIKKHADEAKKRLGGQGYNQYQLDAIVCASYNYGIAGFWSNASAPKKPSPMGPMIARNINDPNIPHVWANSCKNATATKFRKGWTRRRIMEANWFTGHPTPLNEY